MIKEELTFRIELTDQDTNEEASDKFARDFVHSFGLKTFSGTWSSIALDSSKIPEFISRSKKLIGDGVARFAGMCSLLQYIEEDEDTNSEWYELRTLHDMSLVNHNTEIITCKADKMSPNAHVAEWGNTYVSEKFKQVVEDNNLTGLDFVWIKDVGRFRAPQWYLPVIFKPLGRGIDHPWFDCKTLRGSMSAQPLDPKFRCGTYRFRASQIKRDAKIDELHMDIINLFDPEVLTIASFRRFLSDFAPREDFAFTWEYEDSEREGLLLQHRIPCVRRKVRHLLLQSKLIIEDQTIPIQLLSKAPEDVDILDGKKELPSPFYSYVRVDLAVLQKKLDLEWKKFSKIQKPIRRITYNETIRLLLEARRNRPDDFERRLSKNELSNNRIKLPEHWIEILKRSNGFTVNPECTIVPLKGLEEFHTEKQKWCEGVEEEFPTNLIPVASSVTGDWYSLVIQPGDNQDAKVSRISHETCHPDEEWGSIADFLYDMLTNYYESTIS